MIKDDLLDFSGGVRTEDYSVFQTTESASLVNVHCNTGNLKMMDGEVPWITTNHGTATHGFFFLSMTEYESITSRYLLANAMSPAGVYVAIPNELVTEQTQTAGKLKFASIPYTVPSTGSFIYEGALYQYQSIEDSHTSLVSSGFGTAAGGYTITLIDWRPVVKGRNLTNGGDITGYRMTAEQVGSDLFMTFSDEFDAATGVSGYTDGMVVWNGFFRTDGIATTNGTAVAVTNAATFASSVYAGDVIYFRNTNGTWSDGYVIKEQASADALVLEKTAGTRTAVDYIISRWHYAGIPAASGTPGAVAANDAGGSMVVGTYQFRWCYRDSRTGRQGDISDVSAEATVPDTKTSVTISGWTTDPCGMGTHVDSVDIYYRYKPSTAVINWTVSDTDWDLLTTATVSWTAGSTSFPASKVFNTAITPATVPVNPIPTELYGFSTVPPYISNIKYYDGRLWGRGKFANRHILYFSNYGNPEAFGMLDETSIGMDPSDVNVLLGGAVQLGATPNDPITAIVAEGGTFSTSGDIGSNLLVFSLNRACRWYGTDWSNFAYRDALGEGCAGPYTVQNVNGYIYWLSRKGFVRMPSGGSQPEIMSAAIYPRGMDSILPSNPAYMPVSIAAAAVWGNYYIACNPSLTVCSGDLLLFDMGNGSVAFCHSNFPSWLMTSADGTLYGLMQFVPIKLFVNTWKDDYEYALRLTPAVGSHPYFTVAATTITYKSRPIYGQTTDNAKAWLTVTASIRRAVDAQTYTLAVYKDGSTAAAYGAVATAAMVVAAGNTSEREIVTWTLTRPRSVSLQIGITATVPRPTTIDFIKVQGELSEELRKA